MELIDLEDDTIDAEVLNSLAVTMENFRVCIAFFFSFNLYSSFCFNEAYISGLPRCLRSFLNYLPILLPKITPVFNHMQIYIYLAVVLHLIDR